MVQHCLPDHPALSWGPLYHQHCKGAQNTSLYLSRTPAPISTKGEGWKSTSIILYWDSSFPHDHLFSFRPDLPMGLEDGPLTPIYFPSSRKLHLLKSSKWKKLYRLTHAKGAAQGYWGFKRLLPNNNPTIMSPSPSDLWIFGFLWSRLENIY